MMKLHEIVIGLPVIVSFYTYDVQYTIYRDNGDGTVVLVNNDGAKTITLVESIRVDTERLTGMLRLLNDIKRLLA